MSLSKAREVISIEANAIQELGRRLDEAFVAALDVIMACKGRVVVCGMGKTGIIARKIAATLSSTGTPSMYLHSAEAVHGDLGLVTQEDVIIVISYSGETDETKRLLPLIKRIGIKMIAITGQAQSSLASNSDVVLNVNVAEEGCPLGLAPMASTTSTLVLGDALAACLIVRKGFRKEDFAFYHPGGSLGKRLLLTVSDLMRKDGAYAAVSQDTPVRDVLLAITRARCGSACVVGDQMCVGLFTDGDLRRHLESGADFLNRPVREVMTTHPAVIHQDRLAHEALTILRKKNVDELPVVDEEKRLVGLIDVQDLLKAGLI